MKSRAYLFTLALMTTATGAASAQPANAAAAQTLFNSGRALEESGQYEEAADRFKRSQELVAAVGTLLNLGACYEKLRKTASAWGAYNQAANLAVTLKDPSRQVRAKVLAEAIAPRVAKLTIVTPKLIDLAVTQNGARVEPAVFDTSAPIDEGQYRIDASAPGRKPWSTRIEIKDGSVLTVTIPELELVPPAAAATVTRPTRNVRWTTGIGLEIGGGAVLAAGIVFGAIAIGSWNSVNDRCHDGTCPDNATRESQQSTRDRASTFATLSTVTTIVGAAALAGGIVLHLTAPKHSVTIVPAVDRTTAGLTLTLFR